MFQKIKNNLVYFFPSHYIKNKWLLWIVRLLCYCITYIFILQTNFLYLTGYIPSLKEIRKPDVSIASEIYTADSVLIGKFYRENRTPVSYNEISPLLIKALVSTEDVRFYKHHGLDLYALISSMVSTAQGDQRGGSTITQQLAKNMFKTRSNNSMGLLQRIPGVSTLVSKTKEWLTAVKLEFFFSKQEILEKYFNTVDFGNNWYGIKVACTNYFQKKPNELTVEEAAMLVGLLKATSTYNPRRNPAKALERRNVVLSQLQKYNEITAAEYDSISKLPLQLNLRKNSSGDEDNSYIRSFAEKFLNDWCFKRNFNLYEDGLKIYLTIDSRLQKFAEEAIHEHIPKVQKSLYNYYGKRNPWVDDRGNEIPNFIEDNIKNTAVYRDLSKAYKGNLDSINMALNLPRRMNIFTWEGAKDTTFSYLDSLRYYAKIYQSGLMCYAPASGHILAYVGGNDFHFFKYDKVSQSKRQPGSTFKTFAYLAAIDSGFSPCDLFVDRPVTITYEENNQTKHWSPYNAKGYFTHDTMTLRQAMGQSCNSITSQLTEKVGWNKVVDYAHRAGVKSELDRVPSICLGSSDVSVYEMVRAYGTIQNDGVSSEPFIVAKINDANGKELESFEPKKKEVFNYETAFIMKYMLMGTLQEYDGTSQALWSFKLFDKGNEVGGKTGTTSNCSDAWYMAITKNLVVGCWVGTDYRAVHLRSEAGQGSRIALPVVGKFLEKAIAAKNPNVEIGRISKPEQKITRSYLCNYVSVHHHDSLHADSLLLNINDSLIMRADSVGGE